MHLERSKDVSGSLSNLEVMSIKIDIAIPIVAGNTTSVRITKQEGDIGST